MKTHELKAWPEPFEALISGAKTCEVRHDDRGFAVGDRLLLREWEPYPQKVLAAEERFELGVAEGPDIWAEPGYTGCWLILEVTHIQRGFGLPVGLVVMSVRKA